MELNELKQQPEIERLRPQLEEKGIDFGKSVAQAQQEAENRQYIAANPDQSEIIMYVVNFLLKLLNENVKPKKKWGQILLNIITFGIPLLFKKK